MKTSIALIGFLALFTFSAYCAEINTEVEKKQNGWYLSRPSYDLIFEYGVDTKTQLCFISGHGITLIPCSNLKKRPEWRDIITWEAR